MNISEHLREAVDETHDFDLDKLARVARAQGTRVRRRRGVTVVLGTAAATLVVSTIGLSAVRHDDGDSTTAGTPAGPRSSEPDLSTTGPASAAGTAAALGYAIAQRQDGEASRFVGRLEAQGGNTAGWLDWTPADNSGTTEINVQISDTSQDGRGATPCTPYLLQCRATDLPDGGRLTTYELHYPGKGVTIRRVAQLVRPDGVIIDLQSLNGTYHNATRTKQGELTRAEPILSFAQMRSVVSEPWWGPNLPTYFLRQGSDLDDFRTDTFFQ